MFDGDCGNVWIMIGGVSNELSAYGRQTPLCYPICLTVLLDSIVIVDAKCQLVCMYGHLVNYLKHQL